MTTFTLDGNSVVFSRNPKKPGEKVSFEQGELKSTDGERLSRDYYIENDLVELGWSNMSAIDKEQTIIFWRDIARGMANSFIWTDTVGTATAVRFAASMAPTFTERAFDSYAVTIRLRVV